MAKVTLSHVKKVKAKGRVYFYFDTGDTKPNGAPILRRLPDISSPDFGTVYATCKAIRTKRDNRERILTVIEAVKLYETSPKFKKLANSTQDKYIIYLKRMAGIFLDPRKGSWPVTSITRPDVRDLLEELGPGARQLQLAVFRQVLRYADSLDKIPPQFDPSKGIRIDHKAKPHDAWPELLVEQALQSEVSLPVALLYYTGQRIGAVARMKWSDIQDGIITVPPFKRTGLLYIPVHKELADILAKEERGLTTIIHKNGKPVSSDALYSRIKSWLGKHPYVPHGLRKNAVNMLIEAGCTVGEVSAITGQTLGMVEHYAKQRNNLKLAMRAMGKWEAQ